MKAAVCHGQGRLKSDELISNRYPPEQIKEAIASVRAGEALRNVTVFDLQALERKTGPAFAT